MNKTNNFVCIYLRKSRADLEAETHGEGETLARHEKILLDLAKRQKLNIIKIYREVVSGETISARPVIQELLTEIEKGTYSGVLVMEVERLARGDTIDQGIIAQTFKFSYTKIITPMKTYDPNNEFDEEYFEFGLFMSRREYKTINRRLQRGREQSAKEGKYIASIAPYGYKRVKIENDKGYTLEIIEEQAEIIRLIFDLYIKHDGLGAIAKKLNEMHIKPCRHEYWQKETLRDIIMNPVYCGKIRWGYRANVKTLKTNSRPINENYILVDGMHDGIISEEIFNLANKTIKENPAMPVGYKDEIKNPLAGLIICVRCGRKMTLRKGYNKKPDYLVCNNRYCNNVGSRFDLVETSVISALSQWLEQYKINWKVSENKNINITETAIKHVDRNIETVKKQLNKAYELLEQEIYTTEIFLERSKTLGEQLNQLIKDKELLVISTNNNSDNLIPKCEYILDVYFTLKSAKDKNNLLKEIIQKIIYLKTSQGGNIELELFSKFDEF